MQDLSGDKVCKPSNEGNITEKDLFDEPSSKENCERSNTLKPLMGNSAEVNRLVPYARNCNLYFRNACRLQPALYSCAVDSFLEICNVVISPFMGNILFESDFFRKIEDFIRRYRSLTNSNYDNDNSLEFRLAEIRQPIWEFLVGKCESFLNRDANAIFSEIFSSPVFDTFTNIERNLFETSCILTGKCTDCNENLRLHECVSLNFITKDDINSLDSFNEWPILLDPIARNRSLQCRCNSICRDLVLQNFSAAEILLIEFFEGYNKMNLLDEEITVKGQNYQLKALVRHQGSHFSCSVLASSATKAWDYIDDLNDKIIHYNSLHSLFFSEKRRLVFLYMYVYVKSINNDSFERSETNEIHFDITQSIPNRKRKFNEECKDYPLRSRK